MTKQSKKISSDEALAQCFEAMLDFSVKSDKLVLESLENRAKFLREMLDLKLESEPLKIFKSSHKEWEREVNDLETQLFHAYEEIGKEVNEQAEFFEKLKSN